MSALATTPISSFSKSWRGRAQLIHGLNWWSVAGGNLRAVAPGAHVEVCFDRAREIGFQFASGLYSKVNQFGQAMEIIPPTSAVRLYPVEEELAPRGWIPGIRPSLEVNGKVYFEGLDPKQRYFLGFTTTHEAWAEGGTTNLEIMREPGEPGASIEGFAGIELAGIIHTNGTRFWPINYRQPVITVIDVADSNDSGFTSVAIDRPFVVMKAHRQVLLVEDLELYYGGWDAYGNLTQWSYLAIERWAAYHGVRICWWRNSFGGAFLGTLGANSRDYFENSSDPLIWKNAFISGIERLYQRTKRATNAITDAGDIGFGAKARIVLGHSIANDMLEGQFIEPAHGNGDTQFVGTTIKNLIGRNDGNPESFIHKARALNPNAFVLIGGATFNDFPGKDTKAQAAAAMDGSSAQHYAFQVGGAHRSWGRYYDIAARNSAHGIPVTPFYLHPNALEHSRLATDVLPELKDLARIVFYVDPVNGNDSNTGHDPSAPWKTAAKINAQTWKSGDVIRLLDGTTLTGPITLGQSGDASGDIWITSYPGTGPKPAIDGGGAAVGIQLTGRANVVVSGIEIKNCTNGIALATSANGIQVRFCDIHACANGIDFAAAITGATNIVEDSTVHDNTGVGVYARGAVSIAIARTTIKANAGAGVKIENTATVTIDGADVTGNLIGVHAGGSSTANVIDHSRVFGNLQQQVRQDTAAGTVTVRNSIVVSPAVPAGADQGAIHADAGGKVVVRASTLDSRNASATVSYLATTIGTGKIELEAVNFNVPANAAARHVKLATNGATNVQASNRCAFHDPGDGARRFMIGAVLGDFAAWKAQAAAGGGTLDVNGASGDLRQVGDPSAIATNARVRAGSIAQKLATAIAGITDDFAGADRPATGAWPSGAFGALAPSHVVIIDPEYVDELLGVGGNE